MKSSLRKYFKFKVHIYTYNVLLWFYIILKYHLNLIDQFPFHMNSMAWQCKYTPIRNKNPVHKQSQFLSQWKGWMRSQWITPMILWDLFTMLTMRILANQKRAIPNNVPPTHLKPTITCDVIINNENSHNQNKLTSINAIWVPASTQNVMFAFSLQIFILLLNCATLYSSENSEEQNTEKKKDDFKAEIARMFEDYYTCINKRNKVYQSFGDVAEAKLLQEGQNVELKCDMWWVQL